MYEALTDYISKFDNIEEYGEWINENDKSDGHVLHIPEIHYSEVVMRFANQIYAFEREHPELDLKNYIEILENNHIKLDALPDANVSVLDGKVVVALLFAAIRKERFCEGALLDALESGCIRRWLMRLKEIDEEGRSTRGDDDMGYYDYSDEDEERLDKAIDEYWAECDGSLEEYAEKINSLNAPEKDMVYFRRDLCDRLEDSYSGGEYRFPYKANKQHTRWKQLYLENAKCLPKESYDWYWSVYYFYKKDYPNTHKYLKQYIEDKETRWWEDQSETLLRDWFFLTFKEAHPGFWREIASLLRQNGYAENLAALCDLMESYYACKTQEEEENVLLDFLQTYPKALVPKEILGELYENSKRWYNAIQCYEQLEDSFLREAYVYFRLAVLHGKVREYELEEEYYRKCLESEPEEEYALNNLGYCLYEQKRYDEAEKIFLQCLAENRDLPYPANNLVRTYLRLGKHQAAKDFIAAKKYKISKSLISQVKSRLWENGDFSLSDDDDDGDAIGESDISENEPAKQQFSNEKILEDELMARIESGQEVFGQKLKIYRRKGDFYGRQYPCSNGEKHWRLDILCEDEEGNIYIIELKKDSGYDDAYQQTKEYVDYFEKHRVPEGKKVYGIICLNSPTEAVMKKVRQDERIRLFEYRISYTEMI